MVGGVALIPLAVSYLGGWGWLTSDTAKWAALAVGIVVASYRVWRQAESRRTTDSMDVLLTEAKMIRERAKRLIEGYEWPPKRAENEDVPWPFRYAAVDSASPLGSELQKLRTWMDDHATLVKKVAETHCIPNASVPILDPNSLSSRTLLTDLDQYIDRMSRLATPPKIWIERLSTLRYRR